MTENCITLWVHDMKLTFGLFSEWKLNQIPPFHICIPFVLKREDYRYTNYEIFWVKPSGSPPYYSKYAMNFHSGEFFVTILPWSAKIARFYTEIQNAPFEDTMEPRLTKRLRDFRDSNKPWTCVVCNMSKQSDEMIACGHSKIHTHFGTVWYKRDLTCGECVLSARAESFVYTVLAKKRNKHDPLPL